MALTTPTTQSTSDSIVSQLQASLSQSIPIFPKAFLRVLAKVIAGVVVLIYKYCGSIFLNLFVTYASDQPTTINGNVLTPLTEWGRLIGVGDPGVATQAQLSVSVTVQNQVGSLSANSPLLFPATGIIYQTVAAVPLNAPTVTVTIRAFSDPSNGDGSGAIGNLNPGDVVEFSNPLPNVAGSATVLAQVVAGADAEATEDYRARVIQRRQAAPQGGALADYRGWAEEVAGIVNAYPYASLPGIVDVYVEADVASSGSPDGIPTPAQCQAVRDNINMDVAGIATRRPTNTLVRVFPITPIAIALEVEGLDPNTTDIQNAIAAGVDEFLRSREPFIPELSPQPRLDRITQAAVGGVVSSITGALGASLTGIGIVPGPSVTLDKGRKAKLQLPVTYI